MTFQPYDYVSAIIAYENNNLDEDATIELFQFLIDTGLLNELQGHYGRVAMRLILTGFCHLPAGSPD